MPPVKNEIQNKDKIIELDQKMFVLGFSYQNNLISKTEASEVIDHPDFDEAFARTFETLQEKLNNEHEEFNAHGFKSWLVKIASEYEVNNNTTGNVIYHLATIPMSGSHFDFKTLTQHPENFRKFSKSFKESGLVNKDHTILVLPFFLNLFETTNLLPGQIRKIVKKCSEYMEAKDITGLSEEISKMINPLEKDCGDGANMEATILIVHAHPANEGNVPFSPETIDNILLHDAVSVSFNNWQQKISKINETILFLPPSSIPRACSTMAFSHVSMSLTYDAIKKNLPIEDIIKNMTVEYDSNLLLFSSSVNGIKLKTISLPVITVLADQEWIENVLHAYK